MEGHLGSTLTDQYVASLQKDGFAIIHEALTPTEVKATLDAVKEILAAEELVARRFGTQSANLVGVHVAQAKHPLLYEFFLNPPVMQVVRRMIGDDCLLYDANARVPMPSGGRNKRQGFQNHVDREDYSVVPFLGGKHYPMAMNVTWALVDFTIENGATMIWPGSHLSCQIPEPEDFPPGYVYAEAPAGSAVIWDAAIWHASGINKGTSPRYAILAYYQRSWMRGRADSQRFFPAKVRAALSDQAKRLYGFSAGVPDYSEVKALDPETLAGLTFEEKRVLGFAVY
jgi:ectoine hydroxylase-related dioxygenase (phytanoyl-CoA dioxygenase family)